MPICIVNIKNWVWVQLKPRSVGKAAYDEQVPCWHVGLRFDVHRLMKQNYTTNFHQTSWVIKSNLSVENVRTSSTKTRAYCTEYSNMRVIRLTCDTCTVWLVCYLIAINFWTPNIAQTPPKTPTTLSGCAEWYFFLTDRVGPKVSFISIWQFLLTTEADSSQ